MSIKIRMRQQGKRNCQTYRLVVIDSRAPRDGKYLEMVGWYSPTSPEGKICQIDGERIRFWVGQGAQLSEKVRSLVIKLHPEVMKEIQAGEIKQRVKKREERKQARKSAKK